VESKKLTDCLLQVKQDLERGSTLSNALAKHPKVFNQFWVSLVEVGEASGTLHIILERVATHLEEKAAFQGKIITAMLYPAVLLCVCIGAILIFSLAIIPKFTEIFKSFGIKVPPLTQALIVFFDFFRTKFLLIILIIGGIIYAIKMYIRTPAGRKQFETFLFKLPMFGNFYVVFLIERFTSQMSILVESGVPILYALEICQRMMGNKTVEDVIGFVKSNVREGKLIAEPMEKTGFFTPMVVQMVLIGEETGELSKMLKKVAVFYQNYVTTFTARVTSLFEPIMVVFMGFIVGTIVIAMFLPIFSIATAGGGAIR
jgi:type IV pilus assembly protein PilC